MVPHLDPNTPQAWGALTTRLNQAIGQARAALAPHAVHLPESTLADFDTLLAEFARQRVRIALYGEVKAGKSTLINAIAGAVLSPAAFEPLTSIPVRVTYGVSTAWRLGEQWIENVVDVERLMRDGAAPGHEVVVETNLDLLQMGGQVDLVDTPGVGSETQLDAVTAEALRTLDAVVLVVRYPALFTQFTRHLVDGLQQDIGKLFVVWNLDAACAELTPEQRTRHAETLREHAAGAQELFLVDARAALRAAQARNTEAVRASGLTSFTDALRRFATSAGRELTALREAAKRSERQLAAARDALRSRQVDVQRALADAQRQLDSTQAATDVEANAERARLNQVDAAIAAIGQQAATDAAKRAADLRRQLRGAQRRWARRGDFVALEVAVADAVNRYADHNEADNRTTFQAVVAEAAAYGAAVPAPTRARVALTVETLGPEERSRRAVTGRWQWLRRSLWQRWYLPGLATLAGQTITSDVAAQADWFNTVAAAARKAATSVLAERLDDISTRGAAVLERIKQDTNFAANDAEAAQLARDLPIVETQLAAVGQVHRESGSLPPPAAAS